ncbi:uncharacterized protein MCYG_08549 [Microsporum canis CBS 113480]|uniref:Uncharacterized protein n=1 Tax=Arthroderma otae (strain ATCC MYA-4605 / CBS 113480) TaxID=554155 RepID=C5G0S7_ARTOC|nr:uncharacterized protein MCYG_08549 [Microsporum canis CBS 113480]EEQ35730.1 predicted protein [Microsporum canis CBS 113480]
MKQATINVDGSYISSTSGWMASEDTAGDTHKEVDGAETAAHGVCSEDEGAENRWADCRVVHDRPRKQRILPGQEQEVVVGIDRVFDAMDDGRDNYHHDRQGQEAWDQHLVWRYCLVILASISGGRSRFAWVSESLRERDYGKEERKRKIRTSFFSESSLFSGCSNEALRPRVFDRGREWARLEQGICWRISGCCRDRRVEERRQ